MNKLYLTTSLALLFFVGISSSLISFSSGAPSGRAGSPIGQGTCATSSCHGTFALNSGPGSMQITSNIPAAGFITGDTYTINVQVSQSGVDRFGFEALAFGESTNAGTGSITLTDVNRTQVRPGDFATHTSAGTSGTDMSSWSFDWTPNADNDSVTFYASGMASNFDGGPSGDHVYNVNQGFSRQFGVSIDPILSIADLAAFPSPATDQLIVEFNSESRGALDLRLLDMQGRTTYSFQDDLNPGPFTQSINVSELPAGIYTMRVHLDGQVESKKVIIQ
jgi:hypothetical protein